ncbi:DUF4145 domain-containing protein [Paraburkholderia dipogonis]|uniref:DUF4145 domain-containing protein n=1 Tax=Paraburkholderia dipogonis TaxID=1211383 RepID=A0ABW9B305_9BURK
MKGEMAGESKATAKAHCPNCDGERTCDVHGHIEKKWEWSDDYGNSVYGTDEYSLLECKGCETVFYEKSSMNSENVDYYYDNHGDTQANYGKEKNTYPKPESRTKPAWFDAMSKIDETLQNILDEMYVAYDNRSYILTAVGLRTALDRATEVLGIDASMSFTKKLEALKGGGWIGDTEKQTLEVVTDAGNAAAHRGWKPDDGEIRHLLMAMEVFLQRAFIVGKAALSIKDKIPRRPK